MRSKALRTVAAGGVATVLALGVACGNSNPAPAASPTSTATATADRGVPLYPGATQTRHTGSTTLLSTDDSVKQVGDFYADALSRDGWKTISKYVGDYSANIVARRGHDGVTVQVTPLGSHTAISVSTYPTG
ncbi:hypothetical protein SLA_4034 [Streptomyces laurentii]|uniref:Lipoprotein n=1 Tax=Streptomyces laurentii TaxID=39478 RepID=A0A160P341_STRLU|nr:hypothetical protein SLA_4034 [Streptomyces laurentii]